MRYSEIFSQPITERDEAFVKEFEDFVNGKMTSPRKVGIAMATTCHRYLQGEMWKVCVAYMRMLALNFHAGRYDDRNASAAKAASIAYQALIDEEIVFDPEFIEREV